MVWLDPPIHVEADRCLRARSPRSTCRRCQEVCPAQAIHLEGREVRIEGDACLGCGLCLTACPTGVFSLPGLSWADLLARAAAADRLSVGCAYASSSADVTLPCLGLLNDDLLLALAARGVTDLALHTADCEACPIGAGGVIEAGVARARERWSGAPRVTWERSPRRGSGDPRAALSALASPLETLVDRRGFFRLLGAQAGRAVGRQLAQALPQEPPPSQGRPVRPTTTRSVLLQALGERQDGVAFPRYTIGPACDDCQDADSLCVRFCPTGAMRREPAEGGARIVFQPALCVGCDLCVDLCPQEAVQREGLEAGGAAVTLRTFRAARCQRCGQVTTAAVDGLCPACRRRSHLQEMLSHWLFPPSADSPS